MVQACRCQGDLRNRPGDGGALVDCTHRRVLGTPLDLLRVEQRRLLRHPVCNQYVVPGLARCSADHRVVVDQDSNRCVLGEEVECLDLHDTRRTVVAVTPQEQLTGWYTVLCEPVDGVASAVLGATREVHDVVHLGQLAHGLQAPLEDRILGSGGEERDPVLWWFGDMVQPVPDVGEHAVDVDDRQHPWLGHTASRVATTCEPVRSLRICSCEGTRMRISGTWLTTPTTRPPSRSPSSVFITC